MLILSINRILKWVQIYTGRGTYTCPTREINGELFFKIRNEWHKLLDFTSDLTTELISENGKKFSRKVHK